MVTDHLDPLLQRLAYENAHVGEVAHRYLLDLTRQGFARDEAMQLVRDWHAAFQRWTLAVGDVDPDAEDARYFGQHVSGRSWPVTSPEQQSDSVVPLSTLRPSTPVG